VLTRSGGASSSCSIGGEEGAGEGVLVECSVCYEAPAAPPPPLACNHVFCPDCLGRYVVVAMDMPGGVHTLACPAWRCTHTLDDATLACVLPPAQLQRLHRLRAVWRLNTDPCVVWCPGDKCTGHARASVAGACEAVQCNTCCLAFCAACKQAPLPPCGHVCGAGGEAERAEAAVADEAPVPAAVAAAAAAPSEQPDQFDIVEFCKENGYHVCGQCGTLIERAEGCTNMTCVCGHMFCGLCGAAAQAQWVAGCTCLPGHGWLAVDELTPRRPPQGRRCGVDAWSRGDMYTVAMPAPAPKRSLLRRMLAFLPGRRRRDRC